MEDPKNNEIQRSFYDKVFEKKQNWNEKNISGSTKYFLEKFLNSVIGSDITYVLEIGCGDGLLTYFLLKRAVVITAVDISGMAIENMKRQFSEEIASGKLEVVCDDLMDYMKNTEKRFDVIVGSGIIHHIPKSNWDFFFSLAQKILKPGGTFACGPEPNAGGIYSIFWPLARYIYKLFGIEYDWEVEKGTMNMIPKKIKKQLSHVGFKAEINSFQCIPHFHLKILEIIDKKIIDLIKGKYSMYIIVKGKK